MGAVFYAPVKYKVSYDVNDAKLGSIDSDIKSGSTQVEDAKISFKATPAEGARLEYWLIKKGSDERKVMTTDLKSSYDLEISVEDTTKVTAVFTPIETYSLAIKSSKYGTLRVFNRADKELSSGDEIRYGDKLKFKVSPAKDYKFKALKINGKEANAKETFTVTGDVSAAAGVYQNRLQGAAGKKLRITTKSKKVTLKWARPRRRTATTYSSRSAAPSSARSLR